ncbi:aceric acid hydrolase [Rufibacter tibetensis]|uniref:ATP-binding protein n=1 Tax=Rufibacter tibetensis TaxID=512763 RepID=A0A0P0CVI9_9BACT|nr:glycoside hydrolase family 127 protein [Rufibacter tibetensis]ALJ01639.1 ATP-binding protein [Rufibacter tibetensis]
MKKCGVVLVGIMLLGSSLQAQDKSLVNTSGSSFAKLRSVDMGDVTWTQGFWADRFKVCKEAMVPNIWQLYNNAEVSHSFRNFEIAAGLAKGEHSGPSFHDGDFYKVLESLAATYAITKDPRLDQEMDKAIAVIAKAQQEDGYIYTPAIIQKINNKGAGSAFQDKVNFEAYNLGHLMTAACVHHRATGKSSLLHVAIKATDFLYNYYKTASPELARNAICPSHYMGIVEMYRTTKDPKYLELAKNLIDIRGYSKDGTDDNQDRIPFREQKKAMGHAVRASYLYAGVADVYAETGDKSLLSTLNLMWDDVVHRKMYITGGLGSLYDGVSPDGTSYDPKEVQKIHQAFGRDYQLPNYTAHNETCANIGNVLWNWRMLQLTGEARYADIMELALYNSVLSGISMNGKEFLYTNPLAYSDDLPFRQRWSKDRVGYIGLSNCCPPNVVRTVAEVNNYAYSISDKGVWFNLYGGSRLATKFKDGSELKLSQETNYPWDGNIKVRLDQVPRKRAFSLFMRIPGWSKDARILVNGKPYDAKTAPGGYVEVSGKWSKGDNVELIIPMQARLLEANPLVEETRNQVAVKRGPVVYCVESVDFPMDKSVFDLVLPADIEFQPKLMRIANSDVMGLEGKAKLSSSGNWENQLYREVARGNQSVQVRLIPYYAWGNRGHSEMSVWMPLSR